MHSFARSLWKPAKIFKSRSVFDSRALNVFRKIQALNLLSFKHEGGDPQTEKSREHASDILDYFMPKRDVEANGLMLVLAFNYLDKHDAVNNSADAPDQGGDQCHLRKKHSLAGSRP
jgi:hypothetical protein